LGEPAIAQAIEQGRARCPGRQADQSLAAGKMGMGTREVGDLIAKMVS